MVELTIDRLKQALLDAGLEIYRATKSEIRVAERVRMHLMDSGVVVCAGPSRIELTLRSQRSDFPNLSADDLFHKVRASLGANAERHGFRELIAAARDVTDPVDSSLVLDVWHELTYGKDVASLEALVEDVRWALAAAKCVDP